MKVLTAVVTIETDRKVDRSPDIGDSIRGQWLIRELEYLQEQIGNAYPGTTLSFKVELVKE